MGDDNLTGAAGYLGGVLSSAGFEFSYVPSAESPDPALIERTAGLFIVSDFPAKNLPEHLQRMIAAKVASGVSLLMIGGWESYHGLAGEYDRGPLAEVLPVSCLHRDDRVNWCQGVVPAVRAMHPSLQGLPWEEPPIFCGFNETAVKPGAEEVLTARPLVIRDGVLSYAREEYPLLVFGSYGHGRTCALTTDLAPHWVGGWVDWGRERMQAQAPGGQEVEVGDFYARFISQLVRWLLEG